MNSFVRTSELNIHQRSQSKRARRELGAVEYRLPRSTTEPSDYYLRVYNFQSKKNMGPEARPVTQKSRSSAENNFFH